MKSRTRGNSDLSQANLLYRKKKYGQVISLLSPQIFLYRKEPLYHELLAYSCLQTGDFGGAYSYFKRALDLESGRVSTLLGLAVVMLRRRQITDALRLWLDVLDIESSNRQAKKALELAKILEEDDWLNMIDENRLAGILPRQPLLYWPAVMPVALAVLFCAGLTVALWLLFSRLQTPQPSRPGHQFLEFNLRDYSISDYSQFAQLIFTDQELEQEIQKVRRAFHQIKDNLVRYHGNRVLLSNAPLEVKDRISLLFGQLVEPTFTNFTDGFSYAEVSQDSLLYNGVYVQWRGRIANLEVTETSLDFELLVGFETGRILQGRVPVQLEFAADLRGGESVELIAQVSSDNNSEFRLDGRFLRIIRREE